MLPEEDFIWELKNRTQMWEDLLRADRSMLFCNRIQQVKSHVTWGVFYLKTQKMGLQCAGEIRRRIWESKRALNERRAFLTNSPLPIAARRTIFSSKWPIMKYGTETRTSTVPWRRELKQLRCGSDGESRRFLGPNRRRVRECWRERGWEVCWRRG